ncbi:MAG: MarR family transcriptional regulator [Bacteroidota bacterium]|nr:MarR family transcriptional regulator [Bacteroidota bacterium]
MKSTKQYGTRADTALGMWVKLARAYATFNRETVKDIRRYGLTQPQFGALECLGHLGPMTIGELSRKMLVSGGNMTCVVDNLEKEGLVRRQHSDEDRRSVIVALTEKGDALFQDIFPQHAAFIEQLATVLSDEEQGELSRLLKKLGQKIVS